MVFTKAKATLPVSLAIFNAPFVNPAHQIVQPVKLQLEQLDQLITFYSPVRASV